MNEGPLFWTVCAWFRGDGVRVAFKQKLCLTCVAARIAPLQVHSDSNTMTCPNCGIGTSDDYDAVYVNWVQKGMGQLNAECPFCGPCAAMFRAWFMENAERMDDRPLESRGQVAAPRYDANQTLAALGIVSRVRQ